MHVNVVVFVGKYDDLDSGIVERTPEWTVCTYFSDREFGAVFGFGLDWDEVYRFMESVPYMGVD